MNYLGIDWGEKKIGLAIGSDETKIASPILILTFNKVGEEIGKIKEIIEKENIEVVVIGNPIKLSGEEYLSPKLKKFINLVENLGVRVELEDERLSTKLAESLKREFKGYKKVGDDDIAAAVILQSYFDRAL